MKLKEITDFLENLYPLQYQESYDNSGLIIGNKNSEVNKALICVDVTEEIIDEAIMTKSDLIISHHPIIFNSIKKINGNNLIERIIIKAIKNNISIYSAHTNLDNQKSGVNSILCKKLKLKNLNILSPKKDLLKKLICYCPNEYSKKLREALFDAGAGYIGNYDCCSFNADGTGTFRAGEDTNPFVGVKGELHYENETRIEMIFPFDKEGKIISTLINTHPYEEPAYDIYSLDNKYNNIGAGMIGELSKEYDETEFLKEVKKIINIKSIRHSKLLNKKIKKVAVCGGSGSFLINTAIAANADIFLTADIKYHDFALAENKIIIADIGHYESEKFVKELLFNVLNKKFSNFAFFISKINTNYVKYL